MQLQQPLCRQNTRSWVIAIEDIHQNIDRVFADDKIKFTTVMTTLAWLNFIIFQVRYKVAILVFNIVVG